MAGSTGGTILKLGLIGVGGYFLYEWFFATPAAPAAPAIVPATTLPTTAAAATPAAPSTLDTYYSGMVAKASAAGESSSLTPDQWGFYLAEVMGKPAPDPTLVWTQAGFDRTQTMTAAVYWAGMASYLKSTQGLSGLGMYGTLARMGWN